MPRAGFEPATPVTKRSQTYSLDRAATGIGHFALYSAFILIRGFVTNGSRGSSVSIVSDCGLDDRAAVLKSVHTDRQTRCAFILSPYVIIILLEVFFVRK
jgi:hypothetical protein